MKVLIWLILQILFFSTSANALVNMKNGNFSNNWIDIIVPGQGYNLKIERYYSSRSLFIGVFGFGWCSELESSINITSVGEIIHTECGGGLEVTYYPEKFDPTSAKSTVNLIVRAVQLQDKQNGSSTSTGELATLQERLLNDPYQRFLFAKKYHLIDVSKFNTTAGVFVSRNSSLDRIFFDGRYYNRQLSSGRAERYNSEGRLERILDRGGNSLSVTYQGSKILHIADNLGRKLTFFYNPANQLLKKISDGQGLTITYTFQGENLVEVTNAWRNTYTYQYDDRHNLTQIGFPDSTTMKMGYDNGNDWIISYVDRKGCVEKYGFVMSQDDKRNHYWSTVDKTCEDGKLSGRFEFWFKPHADGIGKYLSRVKTVIGDNLEDTNYHPLFGLPIDIKRNDSIEKRFYYGNSLLRQKELKAFNEKKVVVDWHTVFMKYDSQSPRVSEAIKTIFDVTGKKVSVESTFFVYNKRGLLTTAERKGGPRVVVDHDSLGRITGLTDHQNTNLNLSYSPNFAKPEKISQNGLGEVKVEYDPAGGIVKVTSPKGRTIATSVVQKFIEMIEVIGPAADELVI